jgi:hypothetical protein
MRDCWCRKCRDWFDQYHFLLKSGSWSGCGNSKENEHIRYHAGNPLCGDIWQLRDKRYMVVDYVDSFQVGVTFSDGTQGGVKYRDGFRQNVTGGKLISTWEEWPFRYCDYRGWTRETDKCTKEQSLQFLNRRLKLIEVNK